MRVTATVVVFVKRAEILSQIQLCRHLYRCSYPLKSPFAYFVYFAVRFIISAIEKKQASSGNRKRPALIYGVMIEAALLRSDGHGVLSCLQRLL